VELVDVSYRSGSDTWLYPMSLALQSGTTNVLLGATLAGKTTLMRLMAGLDRPTSGKILVDGKDVTGIPVRQRNLAMVYQQFINYPSFTVYENIASPLRLARKSQSEIHRRVSAIAETLHLTPFLERHPSDLSGGQQQRTALARALAKDAELIVLDEPLVNLDYKLREELRAELRQLFAQRGTTVVYATTEPQEALQMGGYTTLLAKGRLIQYGKTVDLYRRPASLATARGFSDPPLNEIPAQWDARQQQLQLAGERCIRITPRQGALLGDASREVLLGVRAHQFNLNASTGAQAVATGPVDLAEISGSETYLHISDDRLQLVAQLPGVHSIKLREICTLHVHAEDLFCFDTHGQLLFAAEG
jgi:glycerol transport system ATP-binding protein